MSNDIMNREELRRWMADYLGGEMSKAERERFEHGMERHPDILADVRELSAALDAMRSLAIDPEPAGRPVIASSTVGQIRGRVLRYAAMIALAFFLGYIVRGLEAPRPASTPSAPLDVRPVDVSPLEARYAVQYLSDESRIGLGRSLIAYSRAVNGNGAEAPQGRGGTPVGRDEVDRLK